MSVEHVFPSADLGIQTPLDIGVGRPDVVTWRSPYGPFGGRGWSEYPIHSLKVELGDHPSGDDAASALVWWDHHVGGMAKPFWLREDVSRHHRGVVCGPERGDGTQTVFIVPVEAAGTVNALFVDGVFQETSAYTVYSTVNRIASNQACNGEDGVTGLTLIGDAASVATAAYLARMGRSSVKVTNDGTNDSISGAHAVCAATATGVYSYGASFYLGGSDASVKVALSWRDDAGGAGSETGTAEVTNTGVTPGVWTDLYGTATAPASTLGVRVRVIKVNQTVTSFFIGGIWFGPGNCSTRPKPFLPAYAPKCIVFNSAAPAARTRVTADFTGKRYWYGARDDSSTSYSVIDGGVIGIAGFKMTEVVPL